MNAYATKFLGLDCNGLVGNYYGLSPAVSITGWSDGEPQKLLSWSSKKLAEGGWGKAEVATAPYIPLVPRRSALDARSGDTLITVLADGTHKHIAVVDGVKAIDDQTVLWSIVEWGCGGSASAHIGKPHAQKLQFGPRKSYGLGFAPNAAKFRYLFAAPDAPFQPATNGRCGQDDI